MKKESFFESDFWAETGKPFCIWTAMACGIAAAVVIAYFLV